MSGLIGVIADHSARYSWFTQALGDLEKPDGTDIRWRFGSNRGTGREIIARECVEEGHEWLFFVDDDEVFAPDVLVRLLSHNQPVVSGLVLQRGAPFHPTAYAADEGKWFLPLDLDSVGHDNLVACAGVGTGALLVRTDVFRQMDGDRPWFTYSDDLGEDLYFCRRLAEIGITPLVDTGCRIGHLIPAAVFAADGPDASWEVGVQLAEGTRLAMNVK